MNLIVYLFSLVPSFLYATTNHIDKILLEKYFKEGGVGTLMIFSALLSAIALPFIVFADPTVLSVGFENILLLGCVAILDLAILWFYLLAMENDEASVVIVFYQLVPVIALGLGYLILDEIPTSMQLIAMVIILIGTSIVSFEIDENNAFKPRWKTIFYMTLACFCWALESVLFKDVALEENVWRSLFWEHLVLVIIGIIMFMTICKYRKSFIKAFKVNSLMILGLNITNESLYMLGNILVAFVVMLAPVSLVLLNVPIQSIFVFVIGAFLTIFFPQISSEKLKRKDVIQKLSAIVVTGIGSYVLVTSGS